MRRAGRHSRRELSSGNGLCVYALLSFIPLASFILFGLKGNEWAWQRGGYASVEELRAKERKRAIAALIVFVISILLVILVVAAGGSSE